MARARGGRSVLGGCMVAWAEAKLSSALSCSVFKCVPAAGLWVWGISHCLHSKLTSRAVHTVVLIGFCCVPLFIVRVGKHVGATVECIWGDRVALRAAGLDRDPRQSPSPELGLARMKGLNWTGGWIMRRFFMQEACEPEREWWSQKGKAEATSGAVDSSLSKDGLCFGVLLDTGLCCANTACVSP